MSGTRAERSGEPRGPVSFSHAHLPGKGQRERDVFSSNSTSEPNTRTSSCAAGHHRRPNPQQHLPRGAAPRLYQCLSQAAPQPQHVPAVRSPPGAAVGPGRLRGPRSTGPGRSARTARGGGQGRGGTYQVYEGQKFPAASIGLMRGHVNGLVIAQDGAIGQEDGGAQHLAGHQRHVARCRGGLGGGGLTASALHFRECRRARLSAGRAGRDGLPEPGRGGARRGGCGCPLGPGRAAAAARAAG